MKKVLFALTAAILLVASCAPSQKLTDGYGISVQRSITLKPDTLNAVQMDSLVNADRLPVISKWTSTYYTDAETKVSYQYKTLYDRTSNIMYTVKVIDDKFVVSKRVLQVK